MDRGRAALAENDLDSALGWLERAHRLAPNDHNIMLSLASACLGHDPQRAAALFGHITEAYDVRQAWVGLAAAHLRMNRPAEALAPLARALARHALVPDMVSLADRIAGVPGGVGWCGLTSGGDVSVHPAEAGSIEVRLDGTPIRGTRLPRSWVIGRRVEVLVDGRPMVGSPIEIDRIRRVAGCVEAWEGGIRGWAWHPGDPDTPVVLTLGSSVSERLQTIEAGMEIVYVPDLGPMARPRAIRLTRGELVDPDRPIHVRGPDGRDLFGSPVEPAAELAGQRDAARLLGRVYAAHRPAPAEPAAGRNGPTNRGVAAIGPSGPPGHGRTATGSRLPVTEPFSRATSGPILRADGAVPAEPMGADNRKRDVAVVIPVHDRAEVVGACLASVLASVPARTRVIVVDDGSRDPALVATIDGLARQRKIRLVRHPRALGFPASANAGILAACGRDVVLLNSDTLVPPGWLERMRDAARGARNIGTVTPFSNDAAILSYPGDPGSNPRPDQAATDRLDRMARRANGGGIVDIPVGVGFCLYVRRDCLEAVGLLRADIFAQGYGEENDFCLRARRLGWRNVALTGLFVGHHGGASFGGQASHLRARNARIIERLHPGHDALIERFTAMDPLADARRRLDLLRWRANGRRWQRAEILITHGDGGGVERRLERSVRAHATAGRRPIVLRPAKRADGAPAIAVQDGTADNYPNLTYEMPRELPALLRLLRSAKPGHVEVHHFLDHPQQAVHDLVGHLDVPYDVHIHDYAWFCPRVSLVGAHDRYCGEPALRDCEACIADLGHFLNEDIPVAALRARSAAFLSGARRVVTPSDDAGGRMRRHFPGLSPVTVPHEDDAAIRRAGEAPPARRPSTLRPGAAGRLRVCVVGGIGVHKGYDVVLACGRDAARRDLALEFIVVGNTIDDERLLATNRIFVTGGYQPDEALSLIVAQRARLGFVPSIWPETWCLSLGDIWRAGLTAVAFDLGAPAERIRRTGRGFLLPLGLPANAINNALVAAAGAIPRA